jgi:hypothetical protein
MEGQREEDSHPSVFIKKRCYLEPKRVLQLSPQENPLKNHFRFHVKPFPHRFLHGTQKGFFLETNRVLHGNKIGYPMGTAEEPFWNPFF